MNIIISACIITCAFGLCVIAEVRSNKKYNKETQKHVLNALKLDAAVTDYAHGWNDALDRLSELVDEL